MQEYDFGQSEPLNDDAATQIENAAGVHLTPQHRQSLKITIDNFVAFSGLDGGVSAADQSNHLEKLARLLEKFSSQLAIVKRSRGDNRPTTIALARLESILMWRVGFTSGQMDGLTAELVGTAAELKTAGRPKNLELDDFLRQLSDIFVAATGTNPGVSKTDTDQRAGKFVDFAMAVFDVMPSHIVRPEKQAIASRWERLWHRMKDTRPVGTVDDGGPGTNTVSA